MSKNRLTRSAGALVAVASATALIGGGVAVAQSEHHQAKSPQRSSGVTVSGHRVRVTISGHRSSSAKGRKAPQQGSGSLSVSGHRVRALPSGTRSAGSR